MSRLLYKTTLTVTRKAPNGGYLDPDTRLWVESPPSVPFSIKCSLQPVKGRSRLLLPDGIRTTDSKLVLTKTELLITDDFFSQECDVVTIKGVDFNVFHVEDWTGFGLSTDHYRCLLVRKDKS